MFTNHFWKFFLDVHTLVGTHTCGYLVINHFTPNICNEYAYACALWHGTMTLTGEHAHVSKKESSIIFHVMSWNISNIFVYQMEIIFDMVKYSMICHGIFCHVTCMVCWFWTWVWPAELSRVASCNGLKTKINKRIHFIILVQPMLQMSKAFK